MFSLRDISIDSVLIGLKSTNQLFAQIESFERSEFRQTADVIGFSTVNVEASIVSEQANVGANFSDYVINVD